MDDPFAIEWKQNGTFAERWPGDEKAFFIAFLNKILLDTHNVMVETIKKGKGKRKIRLL
jgi:hypothetical protein